MLPLPAPYKVSRFRVRFRFSSKCYRFHKNLTVSSFRFHIPDFHSIPEKNSELCVGAARQDAQRIERSSLIESENDMPQKMPYNEVWKWN